MRSVYISKFLNYKSSVPSETLSLFEYLKDYSHKSTVEYIRTLTDKDEIKRLKSQLPAITVSGLFKTRNAKALIEHSGYICIDIDGNDNPHISDFGKLRDELSKSVNVAFSSLSVSGRGVFCIIPISEKDKHIEHFEALRIIFEGLGIFIDKGCKDVSRLRGYSYDDRAYLNEEAIIFTQKVEFKKNVSISKSIKKEVNFNFINKSSLKENNNTTQRVMKIIAQINLKAIDITETYHQWFQIGCALANEFGEEGREMFHLVSQNNPDYHSSTSDNLFSNCLEGNYSISIGTFFYYAEQYGLK